MRAQALAGPREHVAVPPVNGGANVWQHTAERRLPLPGDGIVPDPNVVTNHARTSRAAPDDVWPWLTQMGWHRGGWYTPRWVDRLLFPANWPSASSSTPSFSVTCGQGDVIADGSPGTAQFVVVAHVDAPRLLVLHSTTHVPTQLAGENRGAHRLGVVVRSRPAATAAPGC